jgi:hypothetical protein
MDFMDESARRAARRTSIHALYHNAGLSADQRQQRIDDVQRRIVALTIDQGADAEVLAAVMAEQAARTRLAARATHTIGDSRDTL